MQSIKIDGALFEGGGQILRNAISLSCITQKPVFIYNIRANRPKPGLSAQHFEGIKGCQEICDAKVEGLEMSSLIIKFRPRKISSGDFKIYCETAGSISLLIQVILPVLFYAPGTSKVSLKGGTNVTFSPPIDHQKIVLKSYLEKLGFKFDINILKRGFYPLGEGMAVLNTQPFQGKLKGFNFNDFGEISNITGYCMISGNAPIKILNSAKNEITKNLTEKFKGIPHKIEEIIIDKKESTNSFSHYQLFLHSTNGYILSTGQILKPGISIPTLVLSDMQYLLEMSENGVCVDRNMQDQLIIFMALAEGTSAIQTQPVTNHTRSAIYVCEQFLKKKFEIIEDEKVATIICSDIAD